MGPDAMLPLALFKRKTQIGCCLEAVGCFLLRHVYPLCLNTDRGAVLFISYLTLVRSTCQRVMSQVALILTLCSATYYLPLYYQSADQVSATRSGIDILTYMVGGLHFAARQAHEL